MNRAFELGLHTFIDKILYELFGHQRFLAQIDIGGLPFARVARVIELLSTAIAPVVCGEAGSHEPRRAEER